MDEYDLPNENACWRCDGEGVVSCDSCGGRGANFRMRYKPTDFSYESFAFRHEREGCISCEGTGKETCPECAGTGELILS